MCYKHCISLFLIRIPLVALGAILCRLQRYMQGPFRCGAKRLAVSISYSLYLSPLSLSRITLSLVSLALSLSPSLPRSLSLSSLSLHHYLALFLYALSFSFSLSPCGEDKLRQFDLYDGVAKQSGWQGHGRWACCGLGREDETVGTKTTVYGVLKTHDQSREKHGERAQEKRRKFKPGK